MACAPSTAVQLPTTRLPGGLAVPVQEPPCKPGAARSTSATATSVITAASTASLANLSGSGGLATWPEASSHTVTTLPAGEPAGAGTSPARAESSVVCHRALTHTWQPRPPTANGPMEAGAGSSKTALTACTCSALALISADV
jgi:hypothetical protein